MEENISLQKECSKFFEILDPIRDLLHKTLEGWDTPVVVVFGTESAGKSTILERIAMTPIFPKGEGLCTRLPILVKLRYSETPKKPSLVVQSKMKNRWYEVSGPGEIKLKNASTIVRKEMNKLIESENKNMTGISRKSRIELRLEGPQYPNVDLLDLPGLVQNIRTNEPSDLKKQTYELLSDTIKQTKDRSIYLLIREVGDKARNSQSLEVLQKFKFMTPWTIGVLTKCDEVATKVVLQELNENISDLNKNQGYVATMNEHQEEFLGDLMKQSLAESAFFSNSFFNNIPETQKTTNALILKISQLYTQYLKRTWLPLTLLMLQHEKNEYKIKDKTLGLPKIMTEKDVGSSDLYSLLVQNIIRISRISEEELNSIIDTFILPLQQDMTMELFNVKVYQVIHTFENKYESTLQKIISSIDSVLLQIKDHILQSFQRKMLSDQTHTEYTKNPQSTLCLGRFPYLITKMVEESETCLQIRYQNTLSLLKEHINRELILLKQYDLEKKIIYLNTEDSWQRLQSGISSELITFCTKDIFEVSSLTGTIHGIPAEKLIEDCLQTRIEHQEIQLNFEKVEEQLCKGFTLSKQKVLPYIIDTFKKFDGYNLSFTDLSSMKLQSKSFKKSILHQVDLYKSVVSNTKFVGTKLQNANCTDVQFKKVELTNVDFTQANLTGVSFQSCTIKSPIFIDAKVINVDLSNIDLSQLKGTRVDLTDSVLQGVKLVQAHLKNANLTRVNMEEADLTGADLTGAILKDASLSKACLFDTILTGVDLSATNLDYLLYNENTVWPEGFDYKNAKTIGPHSNFRISSLTQRVLKTLTFVNANLTGMNLLKANLSRLNLSNVNLQDTNLQGANLKGCNLSNANLQGANLQDVDFTGCNFTGVNLQGSDLRNSCLVKIKNWPGSCWADTKNENIALSQDSWGFQRNLSTRRRNYSHRGAFLCGNKKISSDYYFEIKFTRYYNIAIGLTTTKFSSYTDWEQDKKGTYMMFISPNVSYCYFYNNGDEETLKNIPTLDKASNQVVGFHLHGGNLDVYIDGRFVENLCKGLHDKYYIGVALYDTYQSYKLELRDFDAWYPLTTVRK